MWASPGRPRGTMHLAMRSLATCLVLALAACSEEVLVQPELEPTVDRTLRVYSGVLPAARLQLPEVGRAVRYSLDLEPLAEQPMFDVVEVVGTDVRLREQLCEVGEPGFVVDWREVTSWEDAGVALGDDRFLGQPLGYR